VRVQGIGERDPLVSICGETSSCSPDHDGISPIAEDLPTDVNDLGTWAARGSLLFGPRSTRSGRWWRRARAATSSRGSANLSAPSGNVWICDLDLPIAQRRGECRTRGMLGGGDAEGYQPIEVLQMIQKENSCLDAQGNQICPGQLERINANDTAKEIVARQLARNLDSDPYAGDFNRVGDTKNDVWGLSLKGDVVLPRGLDLTSVSGYHTYERLVDLDLDFTPNPLFEVVTEDEGWQFAQSLELGGRVLEDYSPVRWQLGGFYLMEELDVAVENFFPTIQGDLSTLQRDYTQKLWSAAGYAQFQWDFWNDFTLDGGFRYNWEKKEIDYLLVQAQTPFTSVQEDSWQAPTGTIRLTYRFRDDTSAYGKYTRGWKGGHYNATSSFRGVTNAEPETIDAVEAGLKGSYWDGRFELLLNLFHYRYTDYQIFTAQQQLGSQPEFVVLNASDAQIYGADIEASLRPWTGAFFKATVGWLESEFLDFVQKQHHARAARHRRHHIQHRDPELREPDAQLAAVQGRVDRRADASARSLRQPDRPLRRRLERRHLLRRDRGQRYPQCCGRYLPPRGHHRPEAVLAAQRPARLPHPRWQPGAGGLGAEPDGRELQDLRLRRLDLQRHHDLLRRRAAHLRHDAHRVLLLIVAR
jgi:outer membrane receptor protein involved in Fe transport